MNKYKVGDVVKLRDDLEVDRGYGLGIHFVSGMNHLKRKPVVIEICEKDSCGEWYKVENGDWNITDEMIEGLWEECKEKQDKLKLIDVLNMIAKGELKEGSKVKYKDAEYTYKKFDAEDDESKDLISDSSCSIFEDYFLTSLQDEVELKEPNHSPDVGKMAEPIDNTKIEEIWGYMAFRSDYERDKVIIDKLNEVINKVNAQTTVLLAQDKYIKEIQEQLDY